MIGLLFNNTPGTTSKLHVVQKIGNFEEIEAKNNDFDNAFGKNYMNTYSLKVEHLLRQVSNCRHVRQRIVV